MSNDQAVFSFELNESLYFEKGQEVAEMLGVSVDPDISIQPFNEYVSIRGVIELQGEYRKVNSTNENEDNILNMEDYHSKRYVEKAVDTVEGIVAFSHRFPVEISVPLYRVNDIDDITVNIESFDYELPNPSHLKLKSTIEINGIKDLGDDIHEEETEEEVETLITQRKEVEKKEEVEKETFQFEIKEIDLPNDLTNEEIIIDETEPKEKERWKYNQSQTFEDFFKKETTPESVESVKNDLTDKETNEPQQHVEVNESSTENEDEPSSEGDINYLADMFRDDDNNEKHSQMRLCIVQDKDTIETIAKRYEIPALQLLKQNRLTDDNILVGQLLNIPYKKN